MALKAVIENEADIPEGVKDEYKKTKVGDKEVFVLDIEQPDALPIVKNLKNENAQRRIELRKANDALEPFKALGNLDEVQAQLARIPELEVLAEGKVDDKKIEKLVETRLAAKVAPVQRELDTVKTTLANKDKEIESFRTKEKTRTIHDIVRKAAAGSKVVDTAVEDVLLHAERVFEVQEDGAVVVKEGVGFIPGLAPDVWLTEMQTKRPHWWPQSQGGGAGGSGGGGGGGKNPWTAEHWNLTEQGKLYRENPSKAEQLSKAAGTMIGGGKPPPKQK